ncbi:MAG: hypothetical protein AABY10_06375 [Nanoarchaeota archaeon]
MNWGGFIFLLKILKMVDKNPKHSKLRGIFKPQTETGRNNLRSIELSSSNKRGQEEMVGLVVIVIIVAVIFLVFLGINISKNNVVKTQKSSETSHFLDAMESFTSECTLNGYTYLSLSDLFEHCNKGSLCVGGKKSCEVLEGSLKALIEKSWNFSPESATKGYRFEAFFESESGKRNKLDLKELENGNCTTQLRGDDRVKPVGKGDKIVYSLVLC